MVDNVAFLHGRQPDASYVHLPRESVQLRCQFRAAVLLLQAVVLHTEKRIQIPMAQGRSTKVIPMIKWIRTSRFSIKNPL